MTMSNSNLFKQKCAIVITFYYRRQDQRNADIIVTITKSLIYGLKKREL